jgi:hypothetical protein
MVNPFFLRFHAVVVSILLTNLESYDSYIFSYLSI